jgi:anti-sigma factor RsiW
MACAEFEERLLEYAELANGERARVDAHTAQCSSCREFLESLGTVDSQLTAQLAGLELTPAFAPAVLRRVRHEGAATRPSLVPELLDFVGWGAIVALLGLLAWWLVPLAPVSNIKPTVSVSAMYAVTGAFLLAAFLFGIRSFADLKH